jgi:methyl-accepting chemotaxis protein
MKSIGSRLMLYFSLTILIIGGGLGLIAYNEASDALQNNSRNSLEELAAKAATIVVHDCESDIIMMEMIANRNVIKSMDWETQLPALQEEAARHGILTMGIVYPDGNARYIDQEKQTFLGDRDYVVKAFNGEVNISDVIISRVTNSAVIMLAAPIYQDNEIAGVLVARRPGTALSDVTNAVRFGENGYAFLVNKEGNVIAHPDDSLVLEQRNFIEDAKTDASLQALADIVTSMINGEEGFGSYTNLNGDQVYVAYAPVAGTDWSLGAVALQEDVLSELSGLQRSIILATIILIVLGLALAFFFGREIALPIVLLSSVLERFAKYDLTFDQNSKALKYMSRKDEIGTITNSIATLQNNFVQILKDIDEQSNEVAASAEEMTAISDQTSIAADEIAKTIEELARGAGDQAEDTEQGAQKVNELAEIIETDEKLLLDLNQTADEVATLKDEGFVTLENLMNKTEESNQAAMEIFAIIQETNQSAEGIKTASEVIKSIADQTNLLALNAAIEAARAGDHGRGFAVVAEEVRKLAEQSNNSVQEIEAIINELTIKTNKAVETMTVVGETISEQTASVNDTRGKFEGIAEAIEKTRQAIELLNSSGKEMNQKKNEIIEIIHNLSAIAEENAAGTEEGAASIEEQTASIQEIASASQALAKLAEEMQIKIRQFKY